VCVCVTALCRGSSAPCLRHQDSTGPRRIGNPTGVPVLVSRQPRIGGGLVLACLSAVVFPASDNRCLGSVAVAGCPLSQAVPFCHSYIVSCTRSERPSGRRRLQSKAGQNTNITAFVYFGLEASSNSEMADNGQQAVAMPRKLWCVFIHPSLIPTSQLLLVIMKPESRSQWHLNSLFILTITQGTPQPREHPHVSIHAGH
jgi:hypothetical protein